MATRVVLTYRDLEAMGESEDGRRYELFEGELVVTPAPNVAHQRAVGELFLRLAAHVKARRLGEVFVSPVDCILSNKTVLEPDLVYVDTTRSGLVSRVPFYWILDPDARSIEAHALAGDTLALAGAETGALPPFDDLAIPAASLWA